MFNNSQTNRDLFENIERQLNNADNIDQCVENSLPDAKFSSCSCPECDSLRCFTIRRDLAKKVCACNDCKPSNMCLIYANDKSDNKPILKTLKSDEIAKANSLPKNVDFCEKTSYHKTIKTKTGQFDKIIESKFNYKAVLADKSYYADTTDGSREKSFTRIQSTILRYPCKNISKTTAQLSAQIMNVPIKDFNQSLSIDKKRDDLVSKLDNVKHDIFSRLKEIYKACSCKVCECIPVNSFFSRTDTCSCKPCDCSECKYLYQYISGIKETPHDGCPCIRCDRKDCRGITKSASKTMICNCEPCQCIKCSESFSKPCTCEPCQCLECRSMPLRSSKNVIVAPVQEYIRRDLCDCSPCECSNCTHNYNTTSNLRERSTGTVTQSFCPCDTCTNDSCQIDEARCRCEMQKGIMKKPIQRDGYDYDIRSLFITNVWPRYDEGSKVNKPDIIAMYAKTPQDCLSIRAKECDCKECKCIACIKMNRSSNVSHISKSDFPDRIPIKNICKCEPCECNTCNKYLGTNKSIILEDAKCKCKNCECLNCRYFDSSRSTVTNNNTRIRQDFVANYVPNHCNCNICECVDCMQSTLGIDGQDRPTREYVIENENTPITSLPKIVEKNSQKPSKPFLKAMTKDINMTPSRSSKKSKHNVSIYHVLSQHNNYESPKSFAIFDKIEDSSMYLSTQNSNDVLLMPKESSLLRYKTIKYNASHVYHNKLLFRENTTIPLRNDELNQSLSNSHVLQERQTTQPFLEFSDQFDINQYSSKSNTDSLHSFKNKSNFIRPKYLKTLYNKDITAFDYDKVINTLKDAQDFSVKLNEILETYEMANNNFISVSQKLRRLHETMFKSNDTDFIQSNQYNIHFEQNDDDTKNVGDNKYPVLVRHSANSKESSTTSNSSTKNETKLKPIFGSHNLLENIDCVEFQNSIHEPGKCEDDFGDMTITGKCTPRRALNCTVNNGINKKYKVHQGLYKQSKLMLKRLTSNNKILSRKQIVNKCTETISSLLDKKLSLLNTSACTVTCGQQQQDISLNTAVTCIFKDADYYKDAGTDSIEIDNERKNKEDLVLVVQSKAIKKKEDSLNSGQPNNILRKNLYINAERTTQNKYICRIPLLEENIKQVLGLISREISYDIKQENIVTSKRRHSKTLEDKIYCNMRCYLNGIVSRAILKSELKATRRTTFDRYSNPSVKISKVCSKQEKLKASFYSLRRISDHTVLIKWNIPQEISEVQGYEVDGRAVKKIFNPTRSIAVITCLPHSENVLLSIRTLTANTTCNPTTTTVYHPRIK